MTRAEANAAIVAATPLSDADIDGFLACSDAERAELVAAYRDAGKMASPTAWDVVLEILGKCAELATLVSPIASVVATVFSVV